MNPTTIVIFGASGDLTSRKLIPSLYSLFAQDRLPEKIRIVGVARKDFNNDSFREKIRRSIEKFKKASFDTDKWHRFLSSITYFQNDINDGQGFIELDSYLKELSPQGDNRIYYLAMAPQFYETVITSLGKAKMAREENGKFRRVIIEKPFGNDLKSAKKLNTVAHKVFREKQIYRIDHYLGKETVQNILVFRFANAIFDPVWNRNYIDNVQITVSESVGVEHRAGYYDKASVLRDMFQNHLFQLLTLVAMEPPLRYESDHLRNEKVKLLSAIKPISPQDTGIVSVRAQYEGYLEEKGVSTNSQTATFGALQLYIDNWRWQGVPFFLRSGKALDRKLTEIIVKFRCPPHLLFNITSSCQMTSNSLHFLIQPDEGVHLRILTKIPEHGMSVQNVDMDFHFKESFSQIPLPDAYERLLLDALNGDASLFTRSDEIELAWGLMDPIIAGWESTNAPPLVYYKQGTPGPKEADHLMERYKREWLTSCIGQFQCH